MRARRPRRTACPGHGTTEELLAIEEIEIVVNLTIPALHTQIGHQIVAAGKNVWSEKPLALDHESGAELLAAAEAAGVRVACAPDTVLGAGIQTAMRAIARGDIGEPLTATTIFHVPGPEAWHPNPEFLFAHGAGPLFDMGPYYVTTLVHAFGPASRVSAVSSKSREVRTIGSGPRAGTEFAVEVPTHHAALISFEGGQSAQSTFSFQNAHAPRRVRGDQRHRGHARAPRPEHVRRRIDAVDDSGRTSPPPCRPSDRPSAAARACSTWPGRSAAATPNGPPGRSPATCSTCCSQSRRPPSPASRWRSRRPSRSPNPLPESWDPVAATL